MRAHVMAPSIILGLVVSFTAEVTLSGASPAYCSILQHISAKSNVDGAFTRFHGKYGVSLLLPLISGDNALNKSPHRLTLRGGGEKVDLSGDGGVLKEIIKEGEGDSMPQKADDVNVHYTGTLEKDGSKFDSSLDRHSPFTFKLGLGKVIKGWDIGVATMKKGEKAVFTIRSDYAYGAEGSGDKIPGNSTLIFEVELLRWNEKDVTNDGGVFLKGLDKKGTGWRHPDKADEVMVSYTGWCNGAEFCRSEGVETVKLGSPASPLPLGVEKAICKEMKKGSNARIACSPAYAFGPAGLPGKVPPDTPVEYEVELHDWNAVHDVAKDGGIVVTCLGQLDTYGPLCDDAAKVRMLVEGRVVQADGTLGPAFLGPHDSELTVGDGALPEGLERGLEKVKKGQHAMVRLSPRYAYGEGGSAELGVPPNATVNFELTVNEVTPTYQLPLADKLAAAQRRKDQGNALFKDGKVEAALAKYDKAFKLVQYEQGEGDEAEQVKELKGTCHVNRAACFDKQGRGEDCISECNKALELKPANAKALFRRGKSYAGLGKVEEAIKDLQHVLTLDPSSAAAQQQLALVRAKQRAQDQKDKAVFSKMFAAPKKPAAAAAAAAAPPPPPPAEEAVDLELGPDTQMR